MSSSTMMCKLVLVSCVAGLFLLGLAHASFIPTDRPTELDDRILESIVGKGDMSKSITAAAACEAATALAGQIYDCTGEANNVPCFLCQTVDTDVSKVPSSMSPTGIVATGLNINCAGMERYNGSCQNQGCDNTMDAGVKCKGTPAAYTAQF